MDSAHLFPRPRLFQNLLLLLWALLNCGLGVSAQGPGEWTPWVSWTRCSSSCGRGVSVRSRRCLRLPGEDPCWGDSHEYRLCQLPDCPPGAVPFRDLQCALYNGRPVLGTQKTYQWVPFHGAPNQCDLNCLAQGHAFYHSFGRVLDGTACSPGAQGVCVAGRCLSAGCDGLLGSGALEDRCGRCGGANDSCLFVQRVFRDAGAFAGYWNVTLIPEGARHIRVAHRSRNHLALMGGDGRYVLNGDWAVSPPGTYEAAGTHVVYTRDTGPQETLQAAGPTSHNLLLQVLLQEPNPGIEFEFWLPQERYSPFQARVQALGWPLQQPQPREVEPQPPAAPAVIPARTPTLAPDLCPPCPDTRGRAHRLLHYCGSDFVPIDLEVPPDPQPLFWQCGWGVEICAELSSQPAQHDPHQCSRPECWAATARPRRPATRCAYSSSTRTARHCGPASTCGRQATAPARCWHPTGTTCWLSSAL
ncbi:ADAMTS-like protein 5 isoform X3 [Rhinopithecus roxellana]|uniref:ADAMTS-like protein 5 isoform X3 n=1 Tax=Rhinopithecus bieti TaxID=61621 RepID=UPI00083C35BB|nr:PREDICTED: ADAMTS-like protein 5 isoform X3 [Rhinopithecus bieti]XP_030790912.1 ADAMTS-like protein 5 isoform X3 [Rhinopithecus roxellana]